MRSHQVIVALLLAASCGESNVSALRTSALGEPIGDFPSYEERVLLYLTNRARTAPSDFNPGDPYPPSQPLQFDYELTVAARFHAQHIIDESCWCEDHSSCCPLSGSGEDVACSGPTTGCGAVSAEGRLSLFSSAYSGENMAMGQPTPAAAMEAWIFSPGHWANINNPGSNRMGPGNYQSAWVQDFGAAAGPSSVIADGIHFADGQAMRFATTYKQTGSGGPRTALVIVDGECHDLALVNGVPEQGAFETSVSLSAGCHRYYFHFTDGNGNDVTHPSFGSFGVGVATGACEFFIDTRPADTCSPSGQTCMTGDTRHCYTGPFGTEDVGTCEAGAERCVAGQWDGDCRLQVGPADELCDTGLDEDCDGEVDEQCDSPEDGGAPDAGNPDSSSETPGPRAPKSDAGCSSVDGLPSHGPSGWPLIPIAVVTSRRLRTRRVQ